MEKLPIGTVTEANTVYIVSLDRKFTFDGGIMCENALAVIVTLSSILREPIKVSTRNFCYVNNFVRDLY